MIKTLENLQVELAPGVIDDVVTQSFQKSNKKNGHWV